MSLSVSSSCGKAFWELTEPETGLSQPRSLTIFWAFCWLLKNFRKSTASAGCGLLALTMKRSGAPVRALVSPAADDDGGSRMNDQLSATALEAPPFSVMTLNSTDSMYCMAALPDSRFAWAASWDRPLADGLLH